MNRADKKIVERCTKAVEEKACPGGVVGIVQRDGERKLFPFGHFTYDIDSPFVNDDTMYDIASVTKSIPTASLALMLLDKGALSLTDSVSKYLPEFRNSSREKVTIWHLLTYTIDSTPLSSLRDKTPEEIREYVCTRPLEHEPGTIFTYANTPALLLGFVLENMFGASLAQAAHDYFFKPLKMKRTGYLPQKNLHSDIAPTEAGVHGIVHDESAGVFAKAGEVVGHAGLFSTASDILNFLEMLLNGGEMQGRRYFSPRILRDMTTNQISQLGESTGLGWELNQERFMGKYRGEHTFGKTGFTGTSVVCDIERGIAFVILTNRTYPNRPLDDSGINTFRRDIADIILQS